MHYLIQKNFFLSKISPTFSFKKCIFFLWCSSSNLTSTLSCTLYIWCFSSAIVGYTKHNWPRSSPLINFMNHMCQLLDYFSCLPEIVFPTNWFYHSRNKLWWTGHPKCPNFFFFSYWLLKPGCCIFIYFKRNILSGLKFDSIHKIEFK